MFFLVASAFQLILGWLLWSRPGRKVYRAGAIGSFLLIAMWIMTRAMVPPLAPRSGAEPVTALGVLTTGAELATFMLLATALPIPKVTRRWSRWAWGTAAAATFAMLVLLSSAALSYVPFAGNPPSLQVVNAGVSVNYPLVYGMLLPHLWLVGSWSTFAFILAAAVMVGVNVAALTRPKG